MSSTKPRDERKELIAIMQQNIGIYIRAARIVLNRSISDSAEYFNVSESSYKRMEVEVKTLPASLIQRIMLLEDEVDKFAQAQGKTQEELIVNAALSAYKTSIEKRLVNPNDFANILHGSKLNIA